MKRIKQFCLWALLLVLVCGSLAWAAECEWPTCSMPTIRGLDHYVDGVIITNKITTFSGEVVVFSGNVVAFSGD